MDVAACTAASAQERLAFADMVEGLNEEQLSSPSLCAGWNVRTVVGHLASVVTPSKVPFFRAMVRTGGNFHRANDLVACEFGRRSIGDLVEVLRRYAESCFTPPLVGPRGPLTDAIVHSGDVLRPLGLAHTPDSAFVRIALDFVTTGRPIGFVAHRRLDGLRLTASDFDWSWGHQGGGSELTGKGVDLLMGACGRQQALRFLDGPGRQLLAQRLG